MPTTKAKERQAKRAGLDTRVMIEARRILGERNINPAGGDLDRKHLGRNNLIIMKTAIDRQVNNIVGRTRGRRHEFTRSELDQIDQKFAAILDAAISEVFNGTT